MSKHTSIRIVFAAVFSALALLLALVGRRAPEKQTNDGGNDPTPVEAIPIETASASDTARERPLSEKDLSLEERKRIESALLIVRESGESFEQKNASVVFDKQLSERHLLAVVIHAPSTEQVAKFSAVITQQLEQFSDAPTLRALLQEKLNRLYNQFAYFPQKYRALNIGTDASGDVQFVEYHCDELNEATPTEDGNVTISGPFRMNMLGSDGRREERWTERYGYLFKLDKPLQ